ncbi:GNAT family N-acetyltransferase [Bacillus infantis]|uniref:GNAT family N-acetyltransferase n=1 Tax=Bacillus infantis TaxID=324767 RepID=UPI001CD3CE3F|nr:GNAT family N-acetyltransferase [Bacillus infantis]MCA1038464.1 GNAT family N-acetyltransferase [Bacillus infantis]
MNMIEEHISLERLNEEDISGLIELSASVGWDYEREEILTLLNSGTVLGHKTIDGKLVSCSALIPYNTHLAWLGMVIVDPRARGEGLAKEAVRSCLEAADEGTSILLVSTEEGRPLYLRLGFTEVDTIQKYLCREYMPSSPVEKGRVSYIKRFTPDFFESVVEFDRAAFGDGRTVFLKNRIAQAKECLLSFNGDGRLTGYGLSIQGPVNLIIGPIAAENTETAICLLDQLASGHNGQLRIDVPSGQEGFAAFIKDSGFELSAVPPIMIFNGDDMPVRDGRLFALAAQAFG